MTKKVTMICVLKSGVIVKDTIKISKTDIKAFQVINEMKECIENSLGYEKPAVQNITFGKSTILVSEIAAIKFEEN